MVCLHEDDVDAADSCQVLEFLNHRCCHALPTMVLLDSEVVDVQLGPSLLKFGQNVRSKSTDDLAATDGHHRDEGVAGQQVAKGLVTRLPLCVGCWLTKRSAKHRQHVAQEHHVSSFENANVEGLLHRNGCKAQVAGAA